MEGKKLFTGALLLTVLALSFRLTISQPSLTCEEAEDIHVYALQTLGSCEDPATQDSPICGLLGEAISSNFTGSNSTTTASTEDSIDQLFFVTNPVSSVGSWQNYLTQSALTSVADIGEVAYILSQVSESYSGFDSSNVTNEEYFDSWSLPWFAQGDTNLQAASDDSNGYDNLTRSTLYWKAANYYFTGFWPYAFSDNAIHHSQLATDAFRAGIEAHPTWNGIYFNVSFNNGSASAQLPGILITPDITKKLPLIIYTTGTDFTKEETFLEFSRDAVDRGYAVLVYEGPGQGQVIKSPPYMPFYPEWEDVFLVILDYVQNNLTEYVLTDKIAQNGVSLGGYLGSRGCAAHSDRLAACIPNPPQYNVASAYSGFVELLSQNLYSPFLYVAQNDPDLLPEEYQEVWDDYPSILFTLFQTCNATSQAPALITETFTSTGGVIDPELIYLATGYGGVVSGEVNDLYSGIWQGFNNVQEFGEYPIDNISCPVIAIKGTEDDLLGGQEDEWFARLSPATQEKSVLIEYGPDSGGALHCQVGAPNALSAKMFAALNPILQGSTQSAGAPPAQGPTPPVLPTSG